MEKKLATVPSKRETMLSANATVMHLGRIDMVKADSSPSNRPIKAVEYNEKIVETITDVKISAACLFTSCQITNRFCHSDQILGRHSNPKCLFPVDIQRV